MSDGSAPKSRPLPVLRAMIDSVDREVLQLLSRRNALVGEIAAFKRENRVPIRDRIREDEIISDRRQHATPLGLQPDVVESIFRLVLWASRDRQAALKAALPVDVEPRSIAIIGGKGGMGKFMGQLFGDLGHAVMTADLDTKLTPEEAAESAGVVVISVPIDVTVDVIRKLGPRVHDDALLMDVTSIKAEPVKAMLDSTNASVIGTHPLFGPSVHTVQGQRIVITPGRGDTWLDWLRQMFTARGLLIQEATPEEHDHAMAIVQVLTHFSTEVLGTTLMKLNTPVDQTHAFTSPVYLMDLLMTARHFAQSPNLYASIQLSNPKTKEVTQAYANAVAEMNGILEKRDTKAFCQLFRAVHDHFGSFTDEALEQSSYLIDRLVERT